MINPSRPDYTQTPFALTRGTDGYRRAPGAGEVVVSIVTPFFNPGRIFAETAACVFQQSLQSWEWIIVDDCSTDAASLELLAEIAARDPRVRVIRQTCNGGPGRARNEGVRQACSDFIFQLDSDDLIEPLTLEVLFWYCVTRPSCSFAKGYEVGFGAESYLWDKGFHLGPEFLKRNTVQTNSMIRKGVFDAVEGYDPSILHGCEDWDFWLKCASRGFWGNTVPLYLHWYRRRDNHSERWPTFDEGQQMDRFRAMLRSRYPGLWEGGFPPVPNLLHYPCEPVVDELPALNPLSSAAPRLLFIVPHLEMGGSDKFNLDLIEQLITRFGYHVTVVATRRAEHHWASRFFSLTPDVFILSTFLRLPDTPRFLRYLIESRRPECVLISHSALGYQLLPYLRHHYPRIPILDYLHIEEEYWKAGGYPRLSCNYTDHLDLTLVSSQHLKRWVTERGKAASDVQVIYTNQDAERWDPSKLDRAALARKWNLKDGVPTVLFVGRFHQQKRPLFMAQLLRDAERSGLKFQALLAGGGPEEDCLRSYLSRHQVQSVRIVGSVWSEQVIELMAISDVLLLPSLHEGIALVLYEAMSMGLVPLASDVGGQAELVVDGTGFLVRSGEGELAQYLEKLSTLLQDAGLRASMGAAARRRIQEQFGIQKMGDAVVQGLAAARSRAVRRPQAALPHRSALAWASEVLEQTRLENLADELWAQRSEYVAAIKNTVVQVSEKMDRFPLLKGWSARLRRLVKVR